MRAYIRSALIMSMAVGGLSFGHHAAADEVEALQKQVEALTERVEELEKRIGIIDTPAVQKAIQDISGPQNPGNSEVASNWDFLKVGHGYDDVEELLGAPHKIKKGAMEFWYYSDKGLDGPFVKFLFSKVNSWQSPAQ